jgi:ribose transport system permease protein
MKSFHRYGLPFTLAVLFAMFASISPTFPTLANLHSLLMNHVALLSLIALAMTLVVAAGGIDLSVGTAVDMAGFAFIASLANGLPALLAILFGLIAALGVGLFNAVLVAGIRVPPFLATLGTLFIGHSVQQLSTGGGVPIYLIAGPPRPIFSEVDMARPWLSLAAIAVVLVVLDFSVFGRRIVAEGIAPAVARFSGLSVRRDIGLVMLGSTLLTGIAGIALSSGVHSYSPLSGNAYLMDAIGATFLGTTFDANRRANVIGTILGVLLLSTVKNGLLLAGVSFYWQQVANGTLIFTVLAISFSTKGKEATALSGH